MKSTRNELRIKVDNLIDEIDKLVELPKKPTFYKIEEMVDYIKKNSEGRGFDETPYGLCYHLIVKEPEKFDKFIRDYIIEVMKREGEWSEKSENLFLRLLREETGMSYSDSMFIRQPLIYYSNVIESLDDISPFLNSFNFNLFVTYKNKFLPARELKSKYRNDICEEISFIYKKSINSMINILAANILTADGELFRERIFEEFILPSLDNELKSNEYEIKKSIKESGERTRKRAESEAAMHKEWIVSDIEHVDYLYWQIRRKNNSIAEFFEDHLNESFGKKKLF